LPIDGRGGGRAGPAAPPNIGAGPKRRRCFPVADANHPRADVRRAAIARHRTSAPARARYRRRRRVGRCRGGARPPWRRSPAGSPAAGAPPVEVLDTPPPRVVPDAPRPPPDAAPAEPAPRTVVQTIVSVPAGAAVLRADGEKLGVTPLELAMPYASGTATLEL